MWLKYFRKELTKQRELQKQMFAISMRRHLDLIKRFQQGKLPPQEIEAILTEARERDAQVFKTILGYFLNLGKSINSQKKIIRDGVQLFWVRPKISQQYSPLLEQLHRSLGLRHYNSEPFWPFRIFDYAV